MEQFSYPRMESGDIVLVYGVRKVSKVIVASQKVNPRNLKSGKFSHVALCMCPGLFVHSEPEKGVHLIMASELLNEDRVRKNWKVVRNKQLSLAMSDDTQTYLKVYRATAYFLAQEYNPGVL